MKGCVIYSIPSVRISPDSPYTPVFEQFYCFHTRAASLFTIVWCQFNAIVRLTIGTCFIVEFREEITQNLQDNFFVFQIPRYTFSMILLLRVNSCFFIIVFFLTIIIGIYRSFGELRGIRYYKQDNINVLSIINSQRYKVNCYT